MQKNIVPQHAWIFDVDGVITHPSKKIITEFEVLNYIIKKLEKGKPVVLNTGRSLEWIMDRVINLLLKKTKNKEIFNRFFVVGEMGGVWLTFDKNGKIQKHVDRSLQFPKSLMKRVIQLVKAKYSKSMFFDDTKQTMFSIEMNEELPIDKYKKEQKVLVNDLSKIIKASDLNKNLRIDTTTIAADIMNKHVGKGFAVIRIIDWLKENELKPHKVFAFGDSKSDHGKSF